MVEIKATEPMVVKVEEKEEKVEVVVSAPEVEVKKEAKEEKVEPEAKPATPIKELETKPVAVPEAVVIASPPPSDPAPTPVLEPEPVSAPAPEPEHSFKSDQEAKQAPSASREGDKAEEVAPLPVIPVASTLDTIAKPDHESKSALIAKDTVEGEKPEPLSSNLLKEEAAASGLVPTLAVVSLDIAEPEKKEDTVQLTPEPESSPQTASQPEPISQPEPTPEISAESPVISTPQPVDEKSAAVEETDVVPSTLSVVIEEVESTPAVVEEPAPAPQESVQMPVAETLEPAVKKESIEKIPSPAPITTAEDVPTPSAASDTTQVTTVVQSVGDEPSPVPDAVTPQATISSSGDDTTAEKSARIAQTEPSLSPFLYL
ncbi:hypothetical protein AX16_007346 [Volvariella volvacea WC 439]|nr:hypothetical protein AX16_007346 [Volvariella volvacea WC 439]